MKAKEIISTILENGLTNDKCGFVRFENMDDIEIQFGHPSCYYSIRWGVEYLYYWPGGMAENVFGYCDAGISIVVNGEIEQIYLMRIE